MFADFVLLVLMEHPCSHKLEHCFTNAGKKLRTNPCTVEEARQMQSVFGESYLELFPTTCIKMSLFKCTSQFFYMWAKSYHFKLYKNPI